MTPQERKERDLRERVEAAIAALEYDSSALWEATPGLVGPGRQYVDGIREGHASAIRLLRAALDES